MKELKSENGKVIRMYSYGREEMFLGAIKEGKRFEEIKVLFSGTKSELKEKDNSLTH
jgi:hypothetical protein